jgi:hypothetical protein
MSESFPTWKSGLKSTPELLMALPHGAGAAGVGLQDHLGVLEAFVGDGDGGVGGGGGEAEGEAGEAVHDENSRVVACGLCRSVAARGKRRKDAGVTVAEWPNRQIVK